MLQSIAEKAENASVDWDDAVPENWGTIDNENNKCYALVCFVCPIAIVSKEFNTIVGDISGLVVIVSDFEAEELYEIDERIILDLFGEEALVGWNSKCFTIGDLWWGTIT